MWRRPFPLPRPPLGSLLSPIFFLFDPDFCLFPHCGAWSRANDRYASAMILEKIPLKDKITPSCLQHIIVDYKQQKWTLKNCSVNKFSKTTIKICFNLLQVYQSLLCFLFFVSIIPSSNCVWAVILKFYSIRYPEYQRFFLACGEELRRPQAEDKRVTKTENCAWKTSRGKCNFDLANALPPTHSSFDVKNLT